MKFQKTLGRMALKFEKLFGVDVRALAALRIGLALVILGDLINRAENLSAHYTDFGVLPRYAQLIGDASPWYFSFHFISGTFLFQAILFFLAGYFALAMLVGYKTRLATIVSWILLISLQNRNFLILQGGDVLFRVTLFWAMFLPLNQCWSLDSCDKNSASPRSTQFFSLGTLGYLLQLAFVYWFAALLKTGVEWRIDGTAVYYALNIDQFTTGIGQWFLQYPDVLRFLTIGTLYFEFWGPILFFSPIWTGYIRMIIVFLFWSMHVGFFVAMELGIFPFIGFVSLLGFLPSEFWESAIVKRVGRIFTKFRWGDRQISIGKKILSPIAHLDELVRKFAFPNPTVRRVWQFGAKCFIVFLIFYVVFWNSTNLSTKNFVIPSSLQWVAGIFRLDQHWNMFSPFPIKDDGWFVIPGKLRDGTEVDLFKNGGEVTWEKPKWVSQTYPDERWRKYMMNLWIKDYAEYRLYYGRYLCRQWNLIHQENDKKLESFEMIYMKEDTLPDYQKPIPQKVVIWQHECFAKNEMLD